MRVATTAPSPVQTWLPQPGHWADHTAAAQEADPRSMLALYRAALAARPRLWVDAQAVRWQDTPSDVLAFARGDAQCWASTGTYNLELPEGLSVVLASESGVGPNLPPDTAVWLSRTCES